MIAAHVLRVPSPSQTRARASSSASVRRDDRISDETGSGSEEGKAPWWVAIFLAGGYAVTLLWNAALSWILWQALS